MAKSLWEASLTNSKELPLEYFITTETETDPEDLILTRQKCKLLHQIITDVLCTDGHCSFWGKGKAAIKIKHKSKANTFINELIQRWNLSFPKQDMKLCNM